MKHSWKKIHIEGKDTISQCKVCNLLRINRTIQVERGWKNMIHKVEYFRFGERMIKAGECCTVNNENNENNER